MRVPGRGAVALLVCRAAWLRSTWRTSCSSAPPGGELSLRKVSAFQKKGLRKRVGILVIFPRRPRALLGVRRMLKLGVGAARRGASS